MSISCNDCCNSFDFSKMPSFSSMYFFFSNSIFSIFAFIVFSSFSKLSISFVLPNMLTVLGATDPPDIAPDEFIISPFNVTILNE